MGGLLVVPAVVVAVEVKPVVNAQLLGGQYYYQGSDSGFGAIASLSVSPYMKFNDQWSLVPLYSGAYQGTKLVTDLIGGGTLFQDAQNHNASTKLIRSFGDHWRVKAIGGYGTELLRETEDEGWGNGLYDNRRVSGGTEVEWKLHGENAVRLAADYYAVEFPNYRSLESQTTTPGLGREFNQPNVLDNDNIALKLGSQWVMPAQGLLQVDLSQTWRAFADQHLVLASGGLDAQTRDDTAQMFSTNATWPVWVVPGKRLFGSLGYQWNRVLSNQNHYDASKTFFNPNYYGYTTNNLSSQWSLLVGDNPWSVRLSGAIAEQRYADRKVQDSAGNYYEGLTRVGTAHVGLTFSYPIAKGFQLSASSAYGWSDSNNTNAQVYQYHYQTATYLMGFTYAY